MSDFSLNVVGCQFDNPDGSSRQAEIRKLSPGDPITLRREPTNRHDPSAVAVDSERGVQVGYIGEQRAAWIGSKLDKAMPVKAIVQRVMGARRGAAPCGLVIRINLFGDVPKLP